MFPRYALNRVARLVKRLQKDQNGKIVRASWMGKFLEFGCWAESLRLFDYSFGLFLLPFGLPRRFTSVSHFGGLPRRFPCPIVRRSNTTIASEIWSRSIRRSASILLISIFPAYPESRAAVTNFMATAQ